MSNHLNFRMERIVALDPARPLIRQGNQNRLDSGDAKSVQVIHTNAGYYGEGGRVGHIDFCVNGGRRWAAEKKAAKTELLSVISFSVLYSSYMCPHRQPYCHNTTNVNLCSHIWSVCYMGQFWRRRRATLLHIANYENFHFSLFFASLSSINIW